MKAVLISIQPKWCELIASGKKTVEVKKTKPKLETPFKVYIYCTANKQGVNDLLEIHGTDGKIRKANSKIIGEFVCDKVDYFSSADSEWAYMVAPAGSKMPMHEDTALRIMQKQGCLSLDDINAYFGDEDYKAYFWHISDLVIYDKPKELSEVYHYCGNDPKCDGCEAHYYYNSECGREDECCSLVYGCRPLTRPPQSWCYVERLGEG